MDPAFSLTPVGLEVMVVSVVRRVTVEGLDPGPVPRSPAVRTPPGTVNPAHRD